LFFFFFFFFFFFLFFVFFSVYLAVIFRLFVENNAGSPALLSTEKMKEKKLDSFEALAQKLARALTQLKKEADGTEFAHTVKKALEEVDEGEVERLAQAYDDTAAAAAAKAAAKADKAPESSSESSASESESDELSAPRASGSGESSSESGSESSAGPTMKSRSAAAVATQKPLPTAMSPREKAAAAAEARATSAPPPSSPPRRPSRSLPPSKTTTKSLPPSETTTKVTLPPAAPASTASDGTRVQGLMGSVFRRSRPGQTITVQASQQSTTGMTRTMPAASSQAASSSSTSSSAQGNATQRGTKRKAGNDNDEDNDDDNDDDDDDDDNDDDRSDVDVEKQIGEAIVAAAVPAAPPRSLRSRPTVDSVSAAAQAFCTSANDSHSQRFVTAVRARQLRLALKKEREEGKSGFFWVAASRNSKSGKYKVISLGWDAPLAEIHAPKVDLTRVLPMTNSTWLNNVTIFNAMEKFINEELVGGDIPENWDFLVDNLIPMVPFNEIALIGPSRSSQNFLMKHTRFILKKTYEVYQNKTSKNKN
jgi:hypothetical protein